ncbi:acyl-CoA synthetase [Pelagibius sp. CAU 1746]|uniref:acyl-CoA synthetase n=1 Tax=Pelagibius sp. CAU 1746 TaxID=3140370 RepID=UPI00325B7BE5
MNATALPGHFDQGLERSPANYAALTPIQFLERAALIWPDKVAVIHGDRRLTYRHFWERARRLASALEKAGVGRGDTVAVFAPNVPALLEAHYACPMIGAVLNAINTRLDAATVGFILKHGGAKVLIADRSLSPTTSPALAAASTAPLVIDIDDPEDRSGELLGACDYEAFLTGGDPDFAWRPPSDEWEAIALNYTSGTTGDPKGSVYHHRGAYLNALGNVISFGLTPASVYLWTLPMFHCNGWTHTWAVTAAGGTHVCLRKVDPARIFQFIADHGVTHMSGAPIVLNLLIHAPEEAQRDFPHTVQVATGGAAPPSAVIAGIERLGFHVTHLYGMTESYGPSTICIEQDDWAALPLQKRAEKMARQGVPHVGVAAQQVADPDSGEPVPRDGRTLGMLMIRGNTVMKGYLKNAEATRKAFKNGWLMTGDLAVWHADGYVEIKDREKDIIISGGENISSLEIEECLHRHPDIMEAAVVAAPDEVWGETPVAFVAVKPGADGALTAEQVTGWCRDHLARFKVPRRVVFGPLPKTSTGKVQKFVLRERVLEESA